ncbi:hypothetical protein CC1G_10595 [Coprinopsis cinerea okayama7|uniref:F-box domain-containing protein n=1 Tax=Coprinopsis cinerea (strain Okayama-7 / 130 / ATCC MYA-4618 / FGSC 9003) TaxID=240176 RepID=A8P8M9_COPC7|nr:hypothetical protein CC1G_10595 [Coprinopsis cinerea okayama7\|eukprot:XP_001839602.1 hypothetical protein CC1G_10595 [Coprinopsis cinerea okayama7\
MAPNNHASPIAKLPPNVLGDIFHKAHQAKYSLSRPARPWPEVSISHVCASWRKLMVSPKLAGLWSSFCYDMDRKGKAELERFKTYLERSGSLPLTLILRLYPTTEYDDSLTWSVILNDGVLPLALSQYPRWKSVTLYYSDDPDAVEYMASWGRKVRGKRAEHLESFTALNVKLLDDFDEGEEGDPDPPVPTIFTSGTPKLRSLAINDISGRNLLPPLTNLTELYIETPGVVEKLWVWDEFIGVIQTPTLQRLAIYGEPVYASEDDIDIDDLPSKIHLPSLTHLRYDVCPEPYAEGHELFSLLLPRLSAPLLRSITLGNLNQDVSAPETQLVEDPFPAVETVTLLHCTYNNRTDPSFYHWIAGLTSSATTVKVSDWGPMSQGGGSLSFLAQADGVGAWPRMEKLVHFIEFRDKMDSAADTVVEKIGDVIRAREGLKLVELAEANVPSDKRQNLKLHGTLGARCTVEFYKKRARAFEEAVMFKWVSLQTEYERWGKEDEEELDGELGGWVL